MIFNKEIREHDFTIKPSSALEPDGTTGPFFQQCWEVVGNQVTKKVQGFFDTCIMPKNGTFPSMHVTKSEKPIAKDKHSSNQFMAVLYKIISRCWLETTTVPSQSDLSCSASLCEWNIDLGKHNDSSWGCSWFTHPSK